VSVNLYSELRVTELEIWQPLGAGSHRIQSVQDLVVQGSSWSYRANIQREIERGYILVLRGSTYNTKFPTIRYSKFVQLILNVGMTSIDCIACHLSLKKCEMILCMF